MLYRSSRIKHLVHAGLRRQKHVFWHLELFSARQSYIYSLSTFRLTFLNRHIIVWFSWIFSISEIYWKDRNAGQLVFWKPWPAVELKNVSSVTKHAYCFVFWAQRKPNAILDIYKAFQDRFTFLNLHTII